MIGAFSVCSAKEKTLPLITLIELIHADLFQNGGAQPPSPACENCKLPIHAV